MAIETYYTIRDREIPFSRRELSPKVNVTIPEKANVVFDTREATIASVIALQHTFQVQNSTTLIFVQDSRTHDVPSPFRKNLHKHPIFFHGEAINTLGSFPTKLPGVRIVFSYKS